MYGAMLGDIIGSRFEFDRKGWTKEFELFTEECEYTDDTVMTVAVAEALLNMKEHANVESIKWEVAESMRRWGQRYPYAGYGERFIKWIFSENAEPYGSYGNGSAMRVSAAGWLYDNLQRTREVARATAEVTHNHPEGIKGAECTAAVIWLSRNKVDKEEIKEYVINEFGYDVSESVEELRKRHRHDESCQDALPKALVSFFEGISYEDVVRNAVSLGGDTDTIAAIAGAMAEAYYGIPISLVAKGTGYLDEDILQVVNRFDAKVHGESENKKDLYERNVRLKYVIHELYEEDTPYNHFLFLDFFVERMLEKGEVPMPMVDVNHAMDDIDPNQVCIGDSVPITKEVRLKFDTMIDDEGKQWFPLFTDREELMKGETTNISLNVPIETVLTNAITSDRVNGVVINPFGQAYILTKEALQVMMHQYKEVARRMAGGCEEEE